MHIHRWYKFTGLFGGIKQCRKCKIAKTVQYTGLYLSSDTDYLRRMEEQYRKQVEHNNARVKAGLPPSLTVDKPTRTGSSMEFREEI